MKFFNNLEKNKSQESALLCIHGFTGGPGSYTYLLERVNIAAFTLTLPGHGIDRERINKITLKQLLETIKHKIEELRKEYKRVYLAGYSMGGALSLLSDADGYILFAPAVCKSLNAKQNVLKSFDKSVINPFLLKLCDDEDVDIISYFLTNDLSKAYSTLEEIRDASRCVKRIDKPCYVFLGKKDVVVNYDEAKAFMTTLGAEIITFENSTHALLYDEESNKLIAKASEIINDKFTL